MSNPGFRSRDLSPPAWRASPKSRAPAPQRIPALQPLLDRWRRPLEVPPPLGQSFLQNHLRQRVVKQEERLLAHCAGHPGLSLVGSCVGQARMRAVRLLLTLARNRHAPRAGAPGAARRGRPPSLAATSHSGPSPRTPRTARPRWVQQAPRALKRACRLRGACGCGGRSSRRRLALSDRLPPAGRSGTSGAPSAQPQSPDLRTNMLQLVKHVMRRVMIIWHTR